MKSTEVIFDENKEMYTTPQWLKTEICIKLSDSLSAYYEELSDEYKSKISNLITDIHMWYNVSVDAVIEESRCIYGKKIRNEDLQLINVFILFEQIDNELFGLEFRAEFDIEHGCGLQIKKENDTFEIVKVGTGDVAFC